MNISVGFALIIALLVARFVLCVIAADERARQ